VRKMTGLDWKSDSAATVIHPFRKGNGRIHLNGTSGVKYKTRIEFFDPGFLLMLRERTAVSRQPTNFELLLLDRDLKIRRRNR
jgi:hypothetical protein